MKNKMKSISLIIITSLFFNNLFSQNDLGKSDDAARVALTVFVPENLGDLDATSKQSLKTKLDRVVTNSGLGASFGSRFILTANVIELTKEISATTPVIYAYELEVTLMIGDGVAGTKFASHAVSVKGAGNSKTKAYMSAIKNIKDNDPGYQTFIENGKKKIVEYYNSQCDFILKEAQTLAGKNDFDAAIEKLVSIPEVCKDCYTKAMDAVLPIYKKQIDRQCKISLTDATNAWNAAQNSSGADQAASYLGSIDPNAACYKEAQVLSEKISNRMKEIDQREWSFKLKEQQDKVDIKKAEIQSARDIGVAYGKNQPKTVTTYKIIGWW